MHQRIQLASNNKSNILYISHTLIDENFKPLIHSHPNLEIILVTNGQGKITTLDETFFVKKNDLIIINKNSMHFEENENLEFYALGINKIELTTKEDFSKNTFILSLKESDLNQIKAIYDSLFKEAQKKKFLYQNIIDSYVNIIFKLIERSNKVAITSNEEKDDDSLIFTCKEIIKNNYSANIKLAELAKRLNVSTFYLCHKFKEKTNLSIFTYKLICQIEEAKNLLIITNMSITEISALIGFNNTSYFTKKFKLITNLTPKEFRKINKKS